MSPGDETDWTEKGLSRYTLRDGKGEAAMKQAFVCLGSNMGDAMQNLERARRELAALPGVCTVAASQIYRTEPQGRKEQPWFLNQVLRLECMEDMTACGLLEAMLDMETGMGRIRDASDRFGPRVIDMDLLLFGEECSNDPHVTLPHPRMTERAFVLVPLAELAPDLRLPDGRSIHSLLNALNYRLSGTLIFQ